MRSGLEDYRYEITPDVPGVWNITWAVEPFWVEGGVWAEGAQLDSGFFTWDPNPVEDNTTESARVQFDSLEAILGCLSYLVRSTDEDIRKIFYGNIKEMARL